MHTMACGCIEKSEECYVVSDVQAAVALVYEPDANDVP